MAFYKGYCHIIIFPNLIIGSIFFFQFHYIFICEHLNVLMFVPNTKAFFKY